MVLARPVFWESAREKWVEVVRIGDSGYGGGGVTACEKVRYRCGGGMCLGKGGGGRELWWWRAAVIFQLLLSLNRFILLSLLLPSHELGRYWARILTY